MAELAKTFLKSWFVTRYSGRYTHTHTSGEIVFQFMSFMHFEYRRLKPGHLAASIYTGEKKTQPMTVLSILSISAERALTTD